MSHCQDIGSLLLWKNEMKGWNYLYSVLQRLLPAVLPLYLLLLLFDLFSMDNSSGGFKFLLLQPVPRSKVLMSKTVAAFLFGVVAVVVPVLLVFLLAGLLNGFGSPAYPLLTDMEAFSSFTPKPNNIAADMVASQLRYQPPGFEHWLGLSRFSSWGQKFSIFFTPSPALQYSGIALFSLLCLPQILCFTLFCAAVAMFLSSLTQDSGVSFVLCTFFGLGTFLISAPTVPLTVAARLNPFLYVITVEQLAGIGSSTVLTGCLVLLGYSAIITVISCAIFKKRDVKC